MPAGRGGWDCSFGCQIEKMRQNCWLIDPHRPSAPKTGDTSQNNFFHQPKAAPVLIHVTSTKPQARPHLSSAVRPPPHLLFTSIQTPSSSKLQAKHNEGVLQFSNPPHVRRNPPTPPVNVARCAFKFKFGLKTTLLDCAEIPITYRLGKSISINYIRRRPYLGPYRTELHQMLSAGHRRTR